jgi:hypothetical protein
MTEPRTKRVFERSKRNIEVCHAFAANQSLNDTNINLEGRESMPPGLLPRSLFTLNAGNVGCR